MDGKVKVKPTRIRGTQWDQVRQKNLMENSHMNEHTWKEVLVKSWLRTPLTSSAAGSKQTAALTTEVIYGGCSPSYKQY